MSDLQIFLLFFCLYGIYAILWFTLTKILSELRNIRSFFEIFCDVLRQGLNSDNILDQEVSGDG